MRNLLFAFLLFLGTASLATLPASSPHVGYHAPQSLPHWLVVNVFEAACAQSEHFSDVGAENLVTYYYDATATIDYLGRDAVNPSMGRYSVSYDGGTCIVTSIDSF